MKQTVFTLCGVLLMLAQKGHCAHWCGEKSGLPSGASLGAQERDPQPWARGRLLASQEAFQRLTMPTRCRRRLVGAAELQCRLLHTCETVRVGGTIYRCHLSCKCTPCPHLQGRIRAGSAPAAAMSDLDPEQPYKIRVCRPLYLLINYALAAIRLSRHPSLYDTLLDSCIYPAASTRASQAVIHRIQADGLARSRRRPLPYAVNKMAWCQGCA